MVGTTAGVDGRRGAGATGAAGALGGTGGLAGGPGGGGGAARAGMRPAGSVTASTGPRVDGAFAAAGEGMPADGVPGEDGSEDGAVTSPAPGGRRPRRGPRLRVSGTIVGRRPAWAVGVATGMRNGADAGPVRAAGEPTTSDPGAPGREPRAGSPARSSVTHLLVADDLGRGSPEHGWSAAGYYGRAGPRRPRGQYATR